MFRLNAEKEFLLGEGAGGGWGQEDDQGRFYRVQEGKVLSRDRSHVSHVTSAACTLAEQPGVGLLMLWPVAKTTAKAGNCNRL